MRIALLLGYRILKDGELGALYRALSGSGAKRICHRPGDVAAISKVRPGLIAFKQAHYGGDVEMAAIGFNDALELLHKCSGCQRTSGYFIRIVFHH
jgi:hypothetical protein